MSDVSMLKKQLADVQQGFVADPEPVDNQHRLLKILSEKIPFLSSILQGLDGTGIAITRLLDATGHVSPIIKQATHGFQLANIGLHLGNFIRIPLMYLVAAILGKKIPFTLANSARWLYAGTLLMLATVGFLIPPIGLILAITAASLVLFESVTANVSFLYFRYKLFKILKFTKNQFNQIDGLLQQLKAQADQLNHELGDGQTLPKGVDLKIHALHAQYSEVNREANQLNASLITYNAEKKRFTGLAPVDKGMSFILSSLGVIGISLAAFFPPVGFGILVGVASSGSAYLVGRLTHLVVSGIKSAKPAEAVVPAPVLASDSSILSSTAHTSVQLYGNKAAATISKQLEADKTLDAIEQKIRKAVDAHDLQKLVNCFKEVVVELRDHLEPTMELILYSISEVNNDIKCPLINQLKLAVKTIVLTPADKQHLLSYTPLVNALKLKEVDFNLFKEDPNQGENRADLQNELHL